MNIKKSDMVNLAREISLSQKEGRESQLNKTEAEKAGSSPKAIDVDTLRSQVMVLQKEAKDLQTQISFYQVQLAFLAQLQDTGNWKNELLRFMEEHFPAQKIELENDMDVEDFMNQTQERLGGLSNDLLKKEVQLQNILSAGILEEDVVTIRLFKDVRKSGELFAKLKPEVVATLLKS